VTFEEARSLFPVLGSVAYKVLQLAPIPVTLVK